MKKSILLMITLILAFSLSACVKPTPEDNVITKPITTAPASNTPPPEIDVEKDIEIYKKSFIGKKVYDFTVTNLKEETYKISDLKGQPVIIEFASTNCPSCIEIYPSLTKVKDNHPEIKFVNFYLKDTKDTLNNFWVKNKFKKDMNLIAGNQNMSVVALYKIKYTPTLIFVDKYGVIKRVEVGNLNEEILERFITESFNK